jgi:hypothetical protein
MGRVPQHNLAVAVSCNFDPVSATALAGRVADVFLPPVDSAALARDRAQRPVAVTGVDVTSRQGVFFDEKTGDAMRLDVNNGRLMIPNGPPLVPVSATSFRPPRPSMFFRSADDFTLTFVDPDHIEIKSMEGAVTRYRRARPFSPSASELQQLDGRYESSELGSVFEIVAGAKSVAMRLESDRAKSIDFTPVERDVYMFRGMILRFKRDANGKVTGFTYENPVAKGIEFTRAGDRKADAAPSSLRWRTVKVAVD